MLTEQNIESELSYAYLHAVASRAGVICESVGRHSDDAGIDALLRVKGQLSLASLYTDFTVDVQLKATVADPPETNGRYSYYLKLKNYNDLRSEHVAGNKLLVVLYLPKDSSEWLVHSEDELIARRCAYWVSLRGAADSANEKNQVVYVPKENVLSSDGLRTLLDRFSQGEKIYYDP